MMLDIYAEFVEKYLAIPVLRGEKTPAERFPGAEDTLCIEAMMQDRKDFRPGHPIFWARILPKPRKSHSSLIRAGMNLDGQQAGEFPPV